MGTIERRNGMYPELAGKHALVTGATRGFGKAIALNLARQGVKVIVNFRRSMVEAAEVVEEIKGFGGEAIAIRADVGKLPSLEKLFNRITEEWGQLEIVVANAAFGVPGNMMDATPKYWDVTMSASARSLLDMSKLAVPLMTNNYGRIISITSDGGQKVLPGYGIVGAAKAALESVTRGLAYELGPKGIVVNGVLAGLADTKSSRSIPGAIDVMGHAKFHTPLGRIVEPKDIAKVVAFLASEQADMICGHFITVDGGRNIVG
ncbi:MAG: SDR family oxidoreductase [candidate division Zixibacteria bacterium]|nr:SDR family oxidoreductase [candidate division Zixibacteria bacterium]